MARRFFVSQEKVYFLTKFIDCKQKAWLIHILLSPSHTLIAFHPINSEIVEDNKWSGIFFSLLNLDSIFLFTQLVEFVNWNYFYPNHDCSLRCGPSSFEFFVPFIWANFTMKTQIELREINWYPFIVLDTFCKFNIPAMPEIKTIFSHINQTLPNLILAML